MLMNRDRHLLLPSAVVLVLALTIIGCAAAVPMPSPVPTGSLMAIETRGGMCVEGACSSVLFVDRDGRVHMAAKPPNELGVVPSDELAALEEAIRTTDFSELRSHPFTGTCPTAWDGQEVVFEFDAPTGVERIEGCQVEIDYDAPLFVAVARAVGPFMSLPGGQ